MLSLSQHLNFMVAPGCTAPDALGLAPKLVVPLVLTVPRLRSAPAFADAHGPIGVLAALVHGSEHPVDDLDEVRRVHLLRVLLLELADDFQKIGAVDAGELVLKHGMIRQV